MVLAIGDNAAARLVFASSKCDHITPLLRQLHWLKVPWRIDCKLAVLVFMVWHRHTSLTNFTIQQSQSFEGVCVPLRLMNCLFPIHTLNLWRSSFSSHCCMDLELSSAAYHICSVTSCLLLSLEDILLRTRFTRNYGCRACEVTLSFMDTLIALTYLLTFPLMLFLKFAGCRSTRGHPLKLLYLQLRYYYYCCW